jgi:hypothetical protein
VNQPSPVRNDLPGLRRIVVGAAAVVCIVFGLILILGNSPTYPQTPLVGGIGIAAGVALLLLAIL